MPSQHVVAPLTDSAIFLTLTVADTPEALDKVRSVLGLVPANTKAIDFRCQNTVVHTVVGIGSQLWDRLTTTQRPAQLHDFPREFAGQKHTAPSTPGDILLHVRSGEMGLCWEIVRQVTTALGDAASVVDEVHGFRYFDNRDLLGFVDGTANPQGEEAVEVVHIGDEDPEHKGGSYIHVQNYIHDMAAWEALSVEEQEGVIGRTKFSDVELSGDAMPENSHVALNDIGQDIYRLNMPYGSADGGVNGTYFISFSADPSITEKMLRNMFIGNPEGNYDRILDFSRPVTGAMFYMPTKEMLKEIRNTPANS